MFDLVIRGFLAEQLEFKLMSVIMKTQYKEEIFVDGLVFRRIKTQMQTAIKRASQRRKKILSPMVEKQFFQNDENIVLKQDVLTRHAVALPQKKNIDTPHPLITKLHTALIETHGTIVIGSNNKISCCKKMCDTNRDSLGDLRDKDLNLEYYSFKKTVVMKDHPLTYKIFQENLELSNLIKRLIRTEKMRIGNCTELSTVAAGYLWRFPGNEIKRIEIVKAKEFDHAWLILNRKKESDLLNSTEWGEDCWICDPWWKEEGVFYHAQHFQEKIIEVFAYLIAQYEWLFKDGMLGVPLKTSKKIFKQYKKDFQKGSLCVPIEITNKIDINATPYPFDSSMRISDYYEDISLDQKEKHQKKFNPCLDEIKKFKKKIL